MILLIGNNRDDLLYFTTRLNDKKTDVIFGKYVLYSGTISNQPVIMIDGIYTNILSGSIVSYLIEKYFVLAVIKLGKVQTLSKTLKPGDVVLSRKVLGADVDVTDIQGVRVGQIPNFPHYFMVNNDLINLVANSFSKVSKIQTSSLSIVSSDRHFQDPEELEKYIHDENILSEKLDDTVFDSELYGIALACNLFGIPFISVNVVLGRVGEEFTTRNYLKVLKQFVNVGNSVVNAIGEVGSKEVLRN